MDKTYTDIQFTKDFKGIDCNHQTIAVGRPTDEVQNELSMLEGLATNKNAPAAAKTIYGLAYLMDDKPWYDFRRDLMQLRKVKRHKVRILLLVCSRLVISQR